MKMTPDQARRFILSLAEALEVLEELDEEPEIVINSLHGILDDLSVKLTEAE